MPINADKPYYSQPVISKNNTFTEIWFKYIDQIDKRIGASKLYSLGGTLTNSTTSVGNIGSGVDNLIVFSLQRNVLLNAGDTLEIVAYGTTAANGNAKTIKLLFGSTELFSTGAIALNNSAWEMKATITRISSTTQKCITSFNGDIALITQTTIFINGSEDFTNEINISCTGEATSNDDIIQQGLFIKVFPTT